jgi:hypothetical protein
MLFYLFWLEIKRLSYCSACNDVNRDILFQSLVHIQNSITDDEWKTNVQSAINTPIEVCINIS